MRGAGDQIVMEGEAGAAGERPEPGLAGIECVLQGVGGSPQRIIVPSNEPEIRLLPSGVNARR